MMGPKVHGLAITSMITGILAPITCCCQFVSAPLAVTALITGIIAIGKIKNNPGMFKGGGMAIAGIICGGLGIVLTLIGIFTTIDENLRSQYGGGY